MTSVYTALASADQWFVKLRFQCTDQIPAGGIGNVHMLTGIADRACFMDQRQKRIKLFIKEYFFASQLNVDFLTDQTLVVCMEKLGIILWCVGIVNDSGILHIQKIHGCAAVLYSTFKT